MARQLSQGDGDGTVLGQSSSDKIAFYGETAVARPTITAVGTTTATTTLNETKIDRLYSALETLGLIATTS